MSYDYQGYTPYQLQQATGLPSADAFSNQQSDVTSKQSVFNQNSFEPSTSKPTYTQTSTTGIPSVQEYQMSDRDFNAMQEQNSFNNNIKVAGAAWGAVTDGVNAWGQYEKLKQEKEAFAFNKELQTDQFNLAKDAYDRNVSRSNSISSHYSTSSTGGK